jgi:hypothetical protein
MEKEQIITLLANISKTMGVKCTAVTDDCENSFKFTVIKNGQSISILVLPREWEGQRTMVYNIPDSGNLIWTIPKIIDQMKISLDYEAGKIEPRLSRVASGFMELIGKNVDDFISLAKWKPSPTGYSSQIDNPVNDEVMSLDKHLHRILVTDLSFNIGNQSFNIVEDDHNQTTKLEIHTANSYPDLLIHTLKGKCLGNLIGGIPSDLQKIEIAEIEIAQDKTLVLTLPLEYPE